MAIHAPHTVWRDAHIVPFCEQLLAAYHACECAACTLSDVGICAPMAEGLSESDRARGR